MKKTTFTTLGTALFLIGASFTAVRAEGANTAAEARADIQKTLGFVPGFFLEVPEQALPGMWDEMKTLQMNPNTALRPKLKELIGLGVAAQIPCKYCIEAHTEFAKLNGATEAELGDAVAMAALTRHWSTVLNGIQTDEAKFRKDAAKVVNHIKAVMAGKAAAPTPMEVNDGQSALKDIEQTMGFVPEFLKKFPDAARAAAWNNMKAVELNPNAAVSPKDRELIGLAVAAQIPCRFCVIHHTELAKLDGATEDEIDEAIAMAAFTRQASTLLNGVQADPSQFHNDIVKLIQDARTSAAKNK